MGTDGFTAPAACRHRLGFVAFGEIAQKKEYEAKTVSIQGSALSRRPMEWILNCLRDEQTEISDWGGDLSVTAASDNAHYIPTK